MNDPYIPMNAYIFIGVASLVLAFVTVLDNKQDEDNNSQDNAEQDDKSFTDYLPSFNGNPENTRPENANEVAQQPSSNDNMFSFMGNDKPNGEPPVTQGQQNDMFNSNLNSDQGLAQNEYQQPAQQPPVTQGQQNDMFNSNLNSDQGLVQNEYQAPAQQNDMFNSNLNSDQGLAQNDNQMIQRPQQGQPQQQYGNPFAGGKNKTGKKSDKKNKRNKKTKRYKGK